MKNKYLIILRNHGERNIALPDYFASFPFQNLREHHGDPPKSCTSELKYQQDTIQEISFCLLLTNYGSQHGVHACFNMCFCTICIALSLHWFSLSPKWFQAFVLLCWWCLFCAPEVSQMWCDVMCTHLFCCVETDRCGDCLRMHTQLHCTQSLTDSSLIFPVSEFYIFSVTKLRRFQPSNCSLKLNFV